MRIAVCDDNLIFLEEMQKRLNRYPDVGGISLFSNMEHFTNSYLVMTLGIGVLLAFSGIAFVTHLWLRKQKMQKKEKQIKYAWIFLLYPVSQVILILQLENQIWSEGASSLSSWAMIFSLACDMALLFFMFHQAEKAAIERELAEARQTSELERLHYQEVERRRKEIGRIEENHDMTIRKIRDFLKEGRRGEAEADPGLRKGIRRAGDPSGGQNRRQLSDYQV